jgi:hypothetical protein
VRAADGPRSGGRPHTQRAVGRCAPVVDAGRPRLAETSPTAARRARPRVTSTSASVSRLISWSRQPSIAQSASLTSRIAPSASSSAPPMGECSKATRHCCSEASSWLVAAMSSETSRALMCTGEPGSSRRCLAATSSQTWPVGVLTCTVPRALPVASSLASSVRRAARSASSSMAANRPSREPRSTSHPSTVRTLPLAASSRPSAVSRSTKSASVCTSASTELGGASAPPGSPAARAGTASPTVTPRRSDISFGIGSPQAHLRAGQA